MLCPDDKFYKSSKKLIDDVTSGKKVAIVSYIVILETIHVLREKMTKGHKFETDYDTYHAQIEHRIREDTKKICVKFTLLLVEDK